NAGSGIARSVKLLNDQHRWCLDRLAVLARDFLRKQRRNDFEIGSRLFLTHTNHGVPAMGVEIRVEDFKEFLLEFVARSDGARTLALLKRHESYSIPKYIHVSRSVTHNTCSIRTRIIQ